MKKNNISFVVSNNLCAKCGLCYSICPENAIDIKGSIDKIPVVNEACNNCKLCLTTCPGLKPFSNKNELLLGEYKSSYIGYSSDEKIRYSSSSGGIITSLNLALLSEFHFDGIICIKQAENNIFENEVILAITKDDIISAQGSRYSPAYVCRGLKDLPLKKGGRYVFIGKPCDIQALLKFTKIKKHYSFFTIAIFCAQTPSMYGTKEVLMRNKIIDGQVSKFDYRGMGWPGYFTIYSKNNEILLRLDYHKVWNEVLCNIKYINKRCLLCHDCTGEYADMSVGDAWLGEYIGKSSGHSIVISRSDEAERILNLSREMKVLHLEKIDESIVAQSQVSLLSKKNNLYIKKIVSRLIFENVPEENISFNKKTNKLRNIPGLLKYLLLRKLSQ